MKKISIALMCMISFLSCTKECFYNDENTEVDYYVKYHYWAKSGTAQSCNFKITYLNSVTSNSDGAVHTIYPYNGTNIKEDEIICGPFKKNDTVAIEMTNESYVGKRLLEIYVSKDNSPFALRKSTTSNKLEYTIDY